MGTLDGLDRRRPRMGLQAPGHVVTRDLVAARNKLTLRRVVANPQKRRLGDQRIKRRGIGDMMGMARVIKSTYVTT